MKKSIFITGAASGIGKATAISFAESGWNVGLFDINEEGLKEVAQIIGHNRCMYKKLDVTSVNDWIEAESIDLTGYAYTIQTWIRVSPVNFPYQTNIIDFS